MTKKEQEKAEKAMMMLGKVIEDPRGRRHDLYVIWKVDLSQKRWVSRVAYKEIQVRLAFQGILRG